MCGFVDVWVQMEAREGDPEFSDTDIVDCCELPVCVLGTELGSAGRAAHAL